MQGEQHNADFAAGRTFQPDAIPSPVFGNKDAIVVSKPRL